MIPQAEFSIAVIKHAIYEVTFQHTRKPSAGYYEHELTAHSGSVEANAKRSDIVARQNPVASTLLTTGMSEFETRPPDQGGRFCFIRWSC